MVHSQSIFSPSICGTFFKQKQYNFTLQRNGIFVGLCLKWPNIQGVFFDSVYLCSSSWNVQECFIYAYKFNWKQTHEHILRRMRVSVTSCVYNEYCCLVKIQLKATFLWIIQLFHKPWKFNYSWTSLWDNFKVFVFSAVPRQIYSYTKCDSNYSSAANPVFTPSFMNWNSSFLIDLFFPFIQTWCCGHALSV